MQPKAIDSQYQMTSGDVFDLLHLILSIQINYFSAVVQQRYVLTLMAFLALFNAHAMRTNLSMTITRMVVAVVITNETLEYQSQVCSADTFDDLDIDAKYIIAQNPFNNFTSIETTDHDHFEWSQEMQGIILSSFYWGYVLAHLPGGLLAHKYGGKYILAFGIFFSGVLSLLIPVCVHYGGAHSLIAIRMLMGICQGPIIPACMNLLMSWIPLRERCTMLSLVYSGVSVGTIAGTFISALLLHSTHSWHTVFYFFGAMSIIWFFLFILLCYSSPDVHPFINKCEKTYLDHELCQYCNSESNVSIPWRAMLTCAPVYALIISHSVHDWGFYIISTDMNKFLNDVFKMSIETNGIYSLLIHVCELIVALSIGFLSDWIAKKNYLNITSSRKIFASSASLFGAIIFIAISFAGCNKTLVVLFLTLLACSQSLKTPGTFVNILDLAPNYVSILAAIVNGIGSFTGILVPYIIGLLTTNTLLSEWRNVFWLTAGLYMMGLIVFALYGSAQIQSWNEPSVDPKDIEADLKTTKTVKNVVKIGAFLLINAIVLLLITYI